MFKYFNFNILHYTISVFIIHPNGSDRKKEFSTCCEKIKKECLDYINLYQTKIDIENKKIDPNKNKIEDFNKMIGNIEEDMLEIIERCRKGTY